MNHLSLFTGIGGFDLAAEWAGFTNVGQVERDRFCLEVLNKNFPDVPKFKDVKTFPPANFNRRVDILTGGFPCQPFSHAGSRRGREDDRHLWPEMLRIICTLQPTWVVAENVRGLLTIEGGMVFESVCLDLEAAGYEVQPLIIPAVAVNAPHRRDRVWFVAYANKNSNRGRGKQIREAEGVQGVGGETLDARMFSRTDQNVSHSDSPRLQAKGAEQQTEGDRRADQDVTHPAGQGRARCSREDQRRSRQFDRYGSYEGRGWGENWLEVAAEFCSLDDGLPVELGEFKLSKSRHRAEQLKAYGNAIVPEVAYKIFQKINEQIQERNH